MNREIRQRAELFRELTLQHTGTELQYDEAGVRWLDGYIVRNRERQQANRQLQEAAGCFFGECIRKTFGGRWVLHTESGHWMLEIEDNFSIFPFNKLLKHFDGDDGDSVLSLFTMIQPMLAHARTKREPRL
jgi:hypothetical protein